MDIPRLETKLYLDWVQPIEYLKPTIPEELVEKYKVQIRDLLDNQRIGPELRVQDFDMYLSLMNGTDETFIQNFLVETHSFEEYTVQIEKYKYLMDTIPLATQYIIRMDMYDMDRTELIRALELAR
ncbi:hypothetical protein NQ318_007439 [Aromia moschata]|uniref:Uncharacterized protein n=1 Tax=Aromia moschata TaxID=1265417 RepID=A0AAV8YNM9_9CUCU|nr:hypothetical protein NQ318_007439 [Aromia moschata]